MVRFSFKSLCLLVPIYLLAILARMHGAPLSLQGAIDLALKNNLEISAARLQYQHLVSVGKVTHLSPWLPKVKLALYENISQQAGSSISTLQANPLFHFSWRLDCIADPIFDGYIHKNKRQVARYTANKTVQEVLKKVVLGYYALALAQKKQQHAIKILQGAKSALHKAQVKLNLGLVMSIDYLSMQLGWEQASLDCLEAEQSVKQKRALLNILFHRPSNHVIRVVTDISKQPIWEAIPIFEKKIDDWGVQIAEAKMAMAKSLVRKMQWQWLSIFGVGLEYGSHGYHYSFDQPKWKRVSEQKSMVNFSCTLDLFQLFLLPAKIRSQKMEFHKSGMDWSGKKISHEYLVQDNQWNYGYAVKLREIAQRKLLLHKKKLDLLREERRLGRLDWDKLHAQEVLVQQQELILLEAGFKVKELEFEQCQLKNNAI